MREPVRRRANFRRFSGAVGEVFGRGSGHMFWRCLQGGAATGAFGRKISRTSACFGTRAPKPPWRVPPDDLPHHRRKISRTIAAPPCTSHTLQASALDRYGCETYRTAGADCTDFRCGSYRLSMLILSTKHSDCTVLRRPIVPLYGGKLYGLRPYCQAKWFSRFRVVLLWRSSI